jgi:branched-chain amino acid transport system permease protein
VSLALQVIVSGLAAGSVYGLIAIGYSLVYRLTGVFYFALGDLVGLAVFAALLVAAGTGPVTQTNIAPARFVAAIIVGFVVCVLASAGAYAAAVHTHLVRGSTIGWVAAVVAIAFAARSAVAVVFTRPSYVFPDPIPFRKLGHAGFYSVGDATIQLRAFFVIAVALVLAVATSWIVERTRFGLGLRAIASDVTAARLVGVPVDRLVLATFGLAGGLAALAAVVAAPSAPFGVESGALLGVKGLVAALAVRFGSPLRAMVAGLVLGVVEATIANAHVGGFQLGPSYREIVPLVFVLLLIALRPQLEAVEERE